MNIQELKNNLIKVIALQKKIRVKNKNSSGYSLKEYADQFRESIIYVDHGEGDRFAEPLRIASTELDLLSNSDYINRFAATKTKLLLIMGDYIRDLQHELQKFD